MRRVVWKSKDYRNSFEEKESSWTLEKVESRYQWRDVKVVPSNKAHTVPRLLPRNRAALSDVQRHGVVPRKNSPQIDCGRSPSGSPSVLLWRPEENTDVREARVLSYATRIRPCSVTRDCPTECPCPIRMSRNPREPYAHHQTPKLVQDIIFQVS